MTESNVPLLKHLNKETVIAVMTVVTFVTTCKMYNHFIARPKEVYSDVDITKFAIIGVFAVFSTRAAIISLFERPIDLSATIGVQPSPSESKTPVVPSLVKLVR